MAAPAAPTNLRSPVRPGRPVKLFWDHTDEFNIAFYRVYMDGVLAREMGGTAYVANAIYHTHTWAVSAVNSLNEESGLSNQITVTRV